MSRTNTIHPLLLLLLITLSVVSATQISLRNAKLSLTSADGSDSRSFDLSPPTPLPDFQFQRDSILKLTFESIDPTSGQLVKPTQAHLRITDVGGGGGGGGGGGEGWSFGIGMKGRGKGRFDLKASNLPTQLTHSTGSLQLTLLLASPTLSPLKYQLTNLTIPSSLLQPSSPYKTNRHALPPQHNMPTFVIQPPIEHTFQIEEEVVGAVKSLIGTISVIGISWIVLVGLLRKTLKGVKIDKRSSVLKVAFWLSLVGLEGLVFKYWVNWTLGPFIPAFTIASIISSYIGKLTLASIQSNRLSRERERSNIVIPSTGSLGTSGISGSKGTMSSGGIDLGKELVVEKDGKNVKSGVEVVHTGSNTVGTGSGTATGTGTGTGMKNRKGGKK